MQPVVLRLWASTIRTCNRSAYADYASATGLTDYQDTHENCGAQLLMRDRGDGVTEVMTLSWWASIEDVAGFAGSDVERARYYPEDDRFLLEKPTSVARFDVLAPADEATP